MGGSPVRPAVRPLPGGRWERAAGRSSEAVAGGGAVCGVTGDPVTAGQAAAPLGKGCWPGASRPAAHGRSAAPRCFLSAGKDLSDLLGRNSGFVPVRSFQSEKGKEKKRKKKRSL